MRENWIDTLVQIRHRIPLRKCIKMLIAILLAVGTSFGITSILPENYVYSTYEWSAIDDSAAIYDGLSMTQTIEQSFRAEQRYLKSFFLCFQTYNGERQDGVVTVSVSDDEGNDIYLNSVNASGLPDFQFYEFEVNREIQKGKKYICKVAAYSESGISPAIWVRRTNDDVEELSFGGVKTDDVLVCMFQYGSIDWVNIALIVFGLWMCIFFLFFDLKIPIKGRKIVEAVISLVIMPYVTFCLVEYLFQNPFSVSFKTALFNYVIYVAVYLVVYAISNRFSVTIIIANTIMVAAGIVNYFVLIYRGTPICPWDLYAMRTAADVAGGYSFTVSMRLFAVVMLTLGVNIFALVFRERIQIKWFRLSVAAAAVLYTAGFYRLYCTTDFLENEGFEVNLWEQNRGYLQNGYFLSFAMNVQYLQVEKPEGYSTASVEEILDSCGTEQVQQKVKQKPNIIMIMNEAFSDLSVIGDFDTNTEYLTFWNSLEKNTVRGNLFMSIYGGGTANSEYEVLTGNTMAFLANGSIAYQQYINANDVTGGMARSLKDVGYTCYAMHPFGGSNWNRTNVYQAMGFDRFFEMSSFDDTDTTMVRSFISDFDTYRKIIELYENKEKNEPLFIFDVTVQNHGGYESGTQFDDPVELLGTTSYPKVNEYLSLIKISDDAFSYLVRYFENVSEPTMIVMFGDHQPSVEEEFYENLEGKELKDWTLEEIEKRYEVPFVIWTNYDIESEQIDAISANYLGGLVYEYAGITMPKYYSLMNQLRKQLPVINSIGYMDADGEWHSWADADGEGEYSDLLESYRYLHYNSSVDKQGYNQNLYKIGRNK